MTIQSEPDAIQRAHHQLEMLLKRGGGGGTLTIQEELETCWLDLKDDPKVSDPTAAMADLAEWFAGKMQEAISAEIARSPLPKPSDLFEEE